MFSEHRCLVLFCFAFHRELQNSPIDKRTFELEQVVDYMVDSIDFFTGKGRDLTVPRVGMFITDGGGYSQSLDDRAVNAKENHITLFALGLHRMGSHIDEGVLDSLSSEPNELYRYKIETREDNHYVNDMVINNIANVLCLGIDLQLL